MRTKNRRVKVKIKKMIGLRKIRGRGRKKENEDMKWEKILS